MTALRKYMRLESSGLWRETPASRLREVVVGLREATLVLSDPKTEVALSQWSLPAVERLNPGKMPALYGVGAADSETLEIDDTDMAAALETVRQALDRRRPRPGRLRNWVVSGLAIGLAALAIFWLPGRVLSYTAAMLPEATRAELGQDVLADLTKLTGSPCAEKHGKSALAAFVKRISPADPLQIIIVKDVLTKPIHLPGHIVVLPAALLPAASPDVIAGYVLSEIDRAAQTDPTRAVLRYAGPVATMQMLTQGTIDPDALDGFGQTILTPENATLDQNRLLARFEALGISSTAFAYALDSSGETTLTMIEADPHRGGSAPKILTDREWTALQSICTS